ncbi:Exosome complex component RRP43, partial [Stegodyphus mimosarum]
MYDLPIGCSLVQCGSHILLDPTAEEERYSKLREDFGKITIAMMAAYNSQVIYMDSYGSLKNELMHKGLKILQTACQKILIDVRECLKQHVLKKESVDNITADELKLFQPQKYITTFLENNVRPDGRQLIEFRPVLIDVGSFATASGSALVRLSGTSVLCGVKVELTNPTNNEPNKGFFVPNVTLTSICSNRFTAGPPSEQAQVYTRLIMDLWKNSEFLSPEKLCILEGKLAWCIFAEMICLSYDGNILDACVLALIAALKNTRLPEVVINPDDNSIEVTNNTVALDLSSYVFSVTYAVIKDNVIADPSLEEETFEDSSITIFLKEDNTTCIHSSGFVQDDLLMHCIKCAKNRHSEMKSLIDTLN